MLTVNYIVNIKFHFVQLVIGKSDGPDENDAQILICLWPGTALNSTRLIQGFHQVIPRDETLFRNTNCSNENSLLLLCGGRHNNDFPCQCTASELKPPEGIAISDHQWLMCSNYSEKKIKALVRLLISDDHQASVEIWNPILVLTRFYSQDNLIHLIDHLLDIKNSTDKLKATTLTGENALMLLCKYSQNRKMIEITQLLITRGIDINQVDDSGNNALILLYHHNLLHHDEGKVLIQLTDLLISNGLDLNQVNLFGDTALIFIYEQLSSDLIVQITELFIKKGFNVTNQKKTLLALCEYSKSDRLVQVAQLFLAKNISNAIDSYERNALMLLIQNTNQLKNVEEMTKLFISNDINLNHQDENGYNVLLYLCKYFKGDNIVKVAQILIEGGIDVNHKDNLARNALLWLCDNSNNDHIVQVAQLLIANGIAIDQRDKYGTSPFSWLCSYSRSDRIVQFAKLFIANGVDINQTNRDGDNALMALCRRSQSGKIFEIVQLLISNGINIQQKDKQGRNALDLLNRRSTDHVPYKSKIIELIENNSF